MHKSEGKCTKLINPIILDKTRYLTLMLPRKLVALITFRNEALFLPSFMERITPLVDVVLGYNDGSSDSSEEIFVKYGGTLLESPKKVKPTGQGATRQIRNELLEKGRCIGGTHFIVLDADELILYDNRLEVRDLIFNLRPKEKLLCQWIMMSSDGKGYRNSKSVWQPRLKDFVFADHFELSYPQNNFVHFARTPQYINESFSDHRSTAAFSVIHLQFMNWKLGQVKQCWYRIKETVDFKRNYTTVNRTYQFTREEESPDNISRFDFHQLRRLSSLEFSSITSAVITDSWYFQDFACMVERASRFTIQNLDVWYLEELRALFKERFGIEPVHSGFIDALNKWRWRFFHLHYVVSRLIRSVLGR